MQTAIRHVLIASTAVSALCACSVSLADGEQAHDARRFDAARVEPSMAQVQPGQSGEIVWQFTEAGEFQFACLLPGHFEAGMLGKVTVR